MCAKALSYQATGGFIGRKGFLLREMHFIKASFFSILSYFVVQYHNGYENIVDDV